MSKQVTQFIMSVQQKPADFIVRMVATVDDGSYPYGDITAELTQGELRSLQNICERIIRKLEKEAQ